MSSTNGSQPTFDAASEFKSSYDTTTSRSKFSSEVFDLKIEADDLLDPSLTQKGAEEGEKDRRDLSFLAEAMEHDSDADVVPLGAAKPLDRFVKGFDKLADHYEALESALANIKSQTREMDAFSQSLKNEAAKNAAVAEQLVELRADNAELRRVAEAQAGSLEELEAELANKSATLSTVLADFRKTVEQSEEAKARADRFADKAAALTDANEQLTSQLAERKSAYERAISEIENLRTSRADAIEELRLSRQDASDVRCELAELKAEHEKMSVYQEALIADHGKLTEERRQLRRQVAMLDAELSDKKIKLGRIEATNSELVGRFEKEKFTMTKAQEALASELSVAKQRLETQNEQVERLAEKYAAAKQEHQDTLDTMRKNAMALEHSRRELSRANLTISELNLKHSTENITLDQLRDENYELRQRLAKMEKEYAKLQPANSSNSAGFKTEAHEQSEETHESAAKLAAEKVGHDKSDPCDMLARYSKSEGFSTAFNFKSSNYDD